MSRLHFLVLLIVAAVSSVNAQPCGGKRGFLETSSVLARSRRLLTLAELHVQAQCPIIENNPCLCRQIRTLYDPASKTATSKPHDVCFTFDCRSGGNRANNCAGCQMTEETRRCVDSGKAGVVRTDAAGMQQTQLAQGAINSDGSLSICKSANDVNCWLSVDDQAAQTQKNKQAKGASDFANSELGKRLAAKAAGKSFLSISSSAPPKSKTRAASGSTTKSFRRCTTVRGRRVCGTYRTKADHPLAKEASAKSKADEHLKQAAKATTNGNHATAFDHKQQAAKYAAAAKAHHNTAKKQATAKKAPLKKSKKTPAKKTHASKKQMTQF